MKPFLVLIFVMVASLVAVGQRGNGDGNSIIVGCHNAVRIYDKETAGLTMENIADAMYCIGVVHGLEAGLAMDNHIGTVTKGKTRKDNTFPGDDQAVRVVDKYLHDHPEELANRDTELVGVALVKAFPTEQQ